MRSTHPAPGIGRFGRSVLLSLTLGAAFTAASAQATTWVGTATKAMPLKSGLATSAVSSSQTVHVIVSLKLQNQDQLKSLIAGQHTVGNAQYGKYLTPAQFKNAYAPTQAQANSVSSYLSSQGFKNVKISASRMLVTADGTAAQAQTAFNTKLLQFAVSGKNVFAPVQDVQVPSNLGSTVLAVLGLQTAYKKMPNISASYPKSANQPSGGALPSTLAVPADAGSPVLNASYTPAAFRTAYDAGTTAEGGNTVVAISTAGDDLSVVISDLRQAERDNALPYVPVTVKQVSDLPDPQDTSGDGEWDLDSQSSTGIAGNVNQLIFYNATDLGDSLATAYDQFAEDGIARVGNMSYGGCEILDTLLGGSATDDQEFMRAVSQGQTWFASAGDAGASCSVVMNFATPDTGPISVEYPASSPYVVAVGGTSLFTDASYNYSFETTWLATGGGTSLSEPAPAWQSGIVPLSAAGLRGVPDISMDAGFNVYTVVFYSAADIVSAGEHTSVIGTSLSSPLAAGVWSRFVTSHCDQDGSALGFAAPRIYALASSQAPFATASGFTDVTIGTNGLYAATPGWDYTTGFGSMDISKLDAALPAPASSCTVAAAPTAKLSASTSSGKAPLSVTFSGSGSSDPGSLALSWYVIDFGDGSPVEFSSTPSFAAHTYAAAGTYTASLTVRNAQGRVSPVVTKTITASGVPLACVAPGAQVTDVGAVYGVEGVDPFPKADDLLATYIGEPGDMDGKLVFTIKVADLSTVPPLYRWVVYFNIPEDSDLHYVAMVSADGVAPVFNYGTHGVLPVVGLGTFTIDGTLDAASNYNADGTITLVLDKSALGIQTGDKLTNVAASIRVSTPDDPTGSLPLGEGLTVSTGGDPNPYTVVGNSLCASLVGGSSSSGGSSGASSSSSSSSGGSSGTGSSSSSSSGGSSGGSSSGGGSSGGGGGGAAAPGLLLPLLAAALRRRRKLR